MPRTMKRKIGTVVNIRSAWLKRFSRSCEEVAARLALMQPVPANEKALLRVKEIIRRIDEIFAKADRRARAKKRSAGRKGRTARGGSHGSTR